MTDRTAEIHRATKETDVRVSLNLDGAGRAEVTTGLGFYDHMLEQLGKHARFDLTVTCEGDLQVDDHHTVEDTALAVGQAIDQALGERRGIERFGHAYAPLDEALSRAVVDFSGRAHSKVSLGLDCERIGELATEMLTHALHSLAQAARMTLHVDVERGDNAHHRAESAFKALALALRRAVTRTGGDDVPSTKGVL
jgi:imidazoleglycerol-phosphate dehydratase